VPTQEVSRVIENMVVGNHYRIVQTIPGVWIKPRESVMRYIGRDVAANRLLFSARPRFGTQDVSVETIDEIEEVDKDGPEGLIYVAWKIGSRAPEKWTYER
jgi:hypothetical protein